MGAKTYGIKMKDKVGYAFGDLAGLLTFGMIGSFLQMFYTDVLYIDIGKITVLMLVARLWDAINDPIWGAIIDKKKANKEGKFRPYLKWVSLPLAISAVLMFAKIPGLSENQYLIYAYVTYIAYGMLYTAINIPYGSLASVITSDELERSDLSMFRSIGAGIGGLPASVLFPMIVYSQAVGSGAKYLDSNKLVTAVALVSGFSVIIYMFSYKMTKERVIYHEKEKAGNPAKTLKTLLKNKAFVSLCVASMLLIAIQMYTQTIYNYLFKDYFQKPEYYTFVTICTYLPMALLIPFLKKIIRKIGKKEVCAYGAILSFVANIILWLIKTDNPFVYLAFCFVIGLGMTFFVLEVWALVTDVIDYQEYLSHQREEGMCYACFSFTRKLGQTFAAYASLQVLSVIGYDPKHISAEVGEKMYTASAVIPAIMFLLMAVILIVFYPLSKKRLAELHKDDNNTKEIEC